ncbi:MAG: hypothetical protein ACRDWI_06125 [Jiangellaceae bacterium]
MSTEQHATERRVYRVPTAVALRGVGVGAIGLGLCVVAASVLLAVDPAQSVLVGVGIVLAVLSVLFVTVLVVGALRLAGRGARLVLDDEGFLNATGPGAGVRQVAWRDVRRVQSDGPVISVDLAGGRRSLIRTNPIDAEPRVLARELRRHLELRPGGGRPPV